jgi:hypothetical protein
MGDATRANRGMRPLADEATEGIKMKVDLQYAAGAGSAAMD